MSDVTVFTPKDVTTPRDPSTHMESRNFHSPRQMAEPTGEIEVASYHQSPSNFSDPSTTCCDISMETDYSFESRSLASLRVEIPQIPDFHLQFPRRSTVDQLPPEAYSGSPFVSDPTPNNAPAFDLLDHVPWEQGPCTAQAFGIPQYSDQPSNSIDENMNRISMPLPNTTESNCQDEEELREDLEETEQEYGMDQIESFPIMENLLDVLKSQRQYKTAEVLAHCILKASKTLYGKSAGTLNTTISLGSVLYNQGRYHRAEQHVRSVVQDLEADQNLKDGQTLYSSYYHLSIVVEEDSDEPCELLRRKRLNLGVKIYGVNLPSHYYNRGLLAVIVVRGGNFNEALVKLRDVLIGLDRLGNKEGVDSITVSSYLAEALRMKGSLEEAVMVCADKRNKAKSVCGPEYLTTLKFLYYEALIYLDQGNKSQGRKLLSSVVKIGSGILGLSYPQIECAREHLEVLNRGNVALF